MSDGCTCYAREKHGAFWIYDTTTAVCSAVARTPAKKIENVERISFQGLTFARHGDKLSVNPASAASGDRLSCSFCRISAKVYENRPSFTISSFATRKKYQQGPLCLRVLPGVSLSSPEQILGGTFLTSTLSGKRPAVLSGCLSKSS